ncbi:insulin receptor [Ochlerotatus camptorhynchus]|uniref:insulin receptor n=1 Tax=Ochlerotatus camptorhynchus TaxID=644619 RepID=UPI0031D6EFA2
MASLYLYVYVVIFLTMPLVIPKRSRSDAEGLAEAQQQNAVEEYTDDNVPNCHNVDIRNNLARLRRIENCTVITGYLQLVLIERVSHQEFQKYNLTQLREVTGYVMFFHVYNLVSLRELFPNLMVIRGRTVFFNYALIFYDMPHLTEIGLKNLLAIEDGFVNAQHCPRLCYTDTIDWPSITRRSNRSLDLNRFDKPEKLVECNNNRTDLCLGCPRPYCWSRVACQRFHTGYDFTGTIKCHEQCLGGCVNRKDTGCRVCRGFKEGKRCVEKCSEGKVLYDETLRCISKPTCINRGGLLYEGSCLKECPAGYSATDVEELDADFSNHTCYECHEQCPKICEGSQIMYLLDAERLQGCKIINGTLQIRMNEDNPHLVEELKKSLGSIEEIMGYLKVYRSNTLPSLEFLEGLKTIHGQLELGHGNYSLMVYENMNLQKLWNYENFGPLKLIAGSMYFVYNPLLCVSQIELLKNFTKYNNTNDLINVDSNGFMQSCNVEHIRVKAEVLSSRNVTIYWTRFEKAVSQTLLGYIIFFTPSDKPRSPYDGRDVCSEYSWQSKLVQMKDISTHKEFLSHDLTGLKPLTKYAYYVKTYLTDNVHNVTQRKIGQSYVEYFVTKIARPTQPLKVFTTQKTDSSITFSWKILKSEFNLVKSYRVEVFIQPDDQKLLDQRNYCLHPREAYKEPEMVEECTAEMCCSDDSIFLDVPEFSDPDNDFYSRKKRSISHENIAEVQFSSDFHTKMYNTFLNTPQDTADSSTKSHHRAKRETVNFKNRIYLHEFSDVTQFTVTDLWPYHYYTFQLFACSSMNMSYCSAYSIYSDRTYPSLILPTMELTVIKPKTHEHLESNSIVVSFEEPKAVNGAVVAFNVEISALNSKAPFTRRACITRLEHEQAGQQYRFGNLSVGEYMVRAQVVSLVGAETFSDWYFAKVEELLEEQPVDDNSLRNGFITFGVLFSLVLGMIGCYVLYHRMKKHRDDKELLIENDGNEDGFVDCDLR